MKSCKSKTLLLFRIKKHFLHPFRMKYGATVLKRYLTHIGGLHRLLLCVTYRLVGLYKQDVSR